MTDRKKVTFVERATGAGVVADDSNLASVTRLRSNLQPARNVKQGPVMPKRKRIITTQNLDNEHDVHIEETLARYSSKHEGWRYEVRRGRELVLHMSLGLSDRTLDEVVDHARKELAVSLARSAKRRPQPSWKSNAQFLTLKTRVLDIARINGHTQFPTDEQILDIVVACGVHDDALSALTRLAADAAKISEGSS
jgi:hypothetical protein